MKFQFQTHKIIFASQKAVVLFCLFCILAYAHLPNRLLQLLGIYEFCHTYCLEISLVPHYNPYISTSWTLKNTSFFPPNTNPFILFCIFSCFHVSLASEQWRISYSLGLHKHFETQESVIFFRLWQVPIAQTKEQNRNFHCLLLHTCADYLQATLPGPTSCCSEVVSVFCYLHTPCAKDGSMVQVCVWGECSDPEQHYW